MLMRFRETCVVTRFVVNDNIPLSLMLILSITEIVVSRSINSVIGHGADAGGAFIPYSETPEKEVLEKIGC